MVRHTRRSARSSQRVPPSQAGARDEARSTTRCYCVTTSMWSAAGPGEAGACGRGLCVHGNGETYKCFLLKRVVAPCAGKIRTTCLWRAPESLIKHLTPTTPSYIRFTYPRQLLCYFSLLDARSLRLRRYSGHVTHTGSAEAATGQQA